MYHVTETVQVVEHNLLWLVVGALMHCALFHFLYDLKVAQMSVQSSLIQELMLHEFELDHNTVKTIKNICCVKGEGAIDPNIVTKWLK